MEQPAKDLLTHRGRQFRNGKMTAAGTRPPATSKLQRSSAATSDKTALGSIIWILVAGLMPVYRFATASGVSWLPEAIMLLLGLALISGRVRSVPGGGAWIACAVTIALAGVISGTSSNVTASLRTAIGLAIIVGIAPFVFSHYFHASKSFRHRAVTAFVFVQTISAIAALAQVAGMEVLGAQANSGRANGLAGHPNVQGLMCVIAVVLIAVSLRSTKGPLRTTLVLSAAVNMAALIATGSLSALLSLAAAILVLVAVGRAGFRTFYVGIACLGAVLVLALTAGFDPSVLIAPVNHRIDVVTGETDGVASLGIRQQTYAFAWDQIQRDPFIGVGMDPTNQGTFNGVTVVHDYILRAWYQGGLALVLAMTGVTLLVSQRVVRSMSRGTKPAEAAIIAAVLVYALGSAFYDQQQYWLPLLLATASTYVAEEAKSVGGAKVRERQSKPNGANRRTYQPNRLAR